MFKRSLYKNGLYLNIQKSLEDKDRKQEVTPNNIPIKSNELYYREDSREKYK